MLPRLDLKVRDKRLQHRNFTPAQGKVFAQAKLQQTQEEKAYIESGRRCTINFNQDVLTKLKHHLSPSGVYELLSEKFYQPKVMETLLCLTESLILPNSVDNQEKNEEIRHWFRTIEDLSVGKSAYGNTYTATLKGKTVPKAPFVLKVPQTQDSAIEALHELFIGMFGTNLMREDIPNFSYVFGGFKCSKPVDKTFCEANDNILYVMYENIPNSVSLEKFLETCSIEEFQNIMMQIFYSLNMAKQKIDFGHYDQHTGNILVRTLPHKVAISYQTERGEEILVTDKIATFIDYGFCHIVKDNKHFGHFFVDENGGTDLGINPEGSYPFYDTYLLLITSYISASQLIKDYMKSKIIPYITRENFDEFLSFAREGSYRVPAGFESLSYLFVPQILRYEPLPFLFSSQVVPAVPLWNCKKTNCLSITEIGDKLYDHEPMDFYEAYDFMKQGKLEVLEKFRPLYRQNMIKLNNDMKEITFNTGKLIQRYDVLRMMLQNFSKSMETYQRASEFVSLVNEIFDRISRTIYYLKVAAEVTQGLEYDATKLFKVKKDWELRFINIRSLLRILRQIYDICLQYKGVFLQLLVKVETVSQILTKTRAKYLERQ